MFFPSAPFSSHEYNGNKSQVYRNGNIFGILFSIYYVQNVIMYSAEAFIKCTNDKIKRTEASENHLEDSIKKLAQHNKQLKNSLRLRRLNRSMGPTSPRALRHHFCTIIAASCSMQRRILSGTVSALGCAGRARARAATRAACTRTRCRPRTADRGAPAPRRSAPSAAARLRQKATASRAARRGPAAGRRPALALAWRRGRSGASSACAARAAAAAIVDGASVASTTRAAKTARGNLPPRRSRYTVLYRRYFQ